MQTFLKNKAVGFYLSCGAALLALITAIVYPASYATFSIQGGYTMMNWGIFVLLLVMVAAAVLLTLFKQFKWLPWALAAISLATLCLYIYSMYYYVSVMVYGIDASFNATFIFNCILVVATFAVSVVSVFVKQTKEEDA